MPEITGLDLVEQMIRVAAGEKLPLQQKDVKLNGWAVEARLYAEDPFRNFLPSIGRLVKYRPPAEASHDGITVRNDTGVQEGGEISIYYDPMIAKLVTHAPSRAAAIEAQATALDSFYIDGIRHNIPFLSALMNHPRWREGKLSTGFIAEEFPKGFSAHPPEGEVARRLAAVAAAEKAVSDHMAESVTLVGDPADFGQDACGENGANAWDGGQGIGDVLHVFGNGCVDAFLQIFQLADVFQRQLEHQIDGCLEYFGQWIRVAGYSL